MDVSRQRQIHVVALLATLILGAYFLSDYLKERALHAMPKGFTKFSLYAPLPKCGRWREHMPTSRDPAAYRLYIEARKVWRSKIEWQLSREEATQVLTDVQKAADLGDWGARALLAHFYLEGLGPLESNNVLNPDPFKAVEITRMAAQELQPWGLYDLGVAYEHGYGGATYDSDLAWAYYLKAAQLGSPEAQMALADAYREARRFDDEEAMLQCAYQQKHGPAAYKLAIKAEVANQYDKAIQIYQDGVKFGSLQCAAALELVFRKGNFGRRNDAEKDVLTHLGIQIDPGRAARYEAIYDALEINPDLKLSRLDKAVPPPPMQLPAWSGVADVIEPEPTGPPTY